MEIFMIHKKSTLFLKWASSITILFESESLDSSYYIGSDSKNLVYCSSQTLYTSHW